MTLRKSMMVVFIFCLAGCVPSLHQLYTSKTLIYDPAVAGTWQHDEERWQFAGDPNDKSYALTITEKENKQSKLNAHLVNVDGQRFFDFYPADDAELEGGEWLKFHVIAVHLFFKVEQTEPNLVIAAMVPSHVRKLLEEKPELVKHELIEDKRVILTDTPENLQKFLLEGMKSKELFDDIIRLMPVKSQ